MNIRPITSSSATLLSAILLLSACSAQPPKADDSLVRAQTAIDQATLAGAAQYAPMDLNNARSQLQAADADQASGNYKQARYQAEDAEADAQLALARTQSGKSSEAAKQVQQGNQALQNQVNTPSNPPQL